jgi:hypothetical protein
MYSFGFFKKRGAAMSFPNFVLFFLFLLGLARPSLGQDFTHIWSQRFGNEADQWDTRVAVDETGNVLLAGYFWGVVDFGGGALVSAGETDIFVVKLTGNGSYLWSKRFGDATLQKVFDIACDKWGNLIVVGSIEGTVDFGGGPLTSAGASDVFVAKVDPDGHHIWSKRFGDEEPHQAAGSVAVDASGDVILTGLFKGAVDFGGGWLTSAGSYDVFVAKFDPQGNHIWSKRFGDANEQWGGDVAVDGAGNLVVAGTFHGVVDFGGGPLTSEGFGYEGLQDIFMVKFDPAGNHLWSKRFGDPDAQYGGYVAVDAFGSIYSSGGFWSVVDFGGGPLYSTDGGEDMYFVKFDPDGDHIWSQRFGDIEEQYGGEVAIEESGAIVINGDFNGVIDFGGGPLTSAGSLDVFVARFDSAGNHLSSERFGDGTFQQSTGMAVDRWAHVVVAGKFLGTIDFGGGVLTSAGGFDLFVVKFGDSTTGITSTRIGSVMRLDASPNPFNPEIAITYFMPRPALVELRVYDVEGRLIRTLVREAKNFGEHVATWDGLDGRGMAVSSGVYFVRLDMGGQVATRKIAVLR